MTTASAPKAKRMAGRGLVAVALAFVAAALVGCGPWEEPETPASYRVPPPEPPSSEVLAARSEARAAEQATAGASVAASAQAPGPGEIAVGATEDEYADTDPSALTEFKPALAPYGAWVDDPTYGTVWVPREDVVGTDFEPYVTAGRWTYSDATSWVWVSDYDWGWAPFHYGRWVRTPGRGWAWIPGRVYSGAWVTWRTGPVGYEYVGWAPAPPEWYWWNGVAVGWTFGWYHPHYVYCSHAYIYQPGFATYVVRSGPTYGHIHEHTRPYQAPPASGGRVVANPGVNGGGDRVVANPSVNGGGDRVVANPTVGERTIATPKVGGPRPDEIGVKTPIAAPPTSHAGLAKAASFATPRTAMAAGATAPIQMQTRPRASDALVASPSPGQGQVSATAPTRFGGPGSSAYAGRGLEPAARAPQVQGVAPSSRPVPDWRSSRSIGTDAYAPPPVRSPGGSYGGSYPSGPSVSSPSRSSSSVWSSSPSPSYRSSSPSVSSPSPSFRSSSPSVSSPSPSFRSSSPSVSAPSRPSVSSSPSPSFRSASPSVSSPVRSSPAPSSGSRSTSTRSSRGRR